MKKFDCIPDSLSPVDYITFDGKKEYKSELGGCCTIFGIIIFAIFFFNSAIPIWNREKFNLNIHTMKRDHYPLLSKLPRFQVSITSDKETADVFRAKYKIKADFTDEIGGKNTIPVYCYKDYLNTKKLICEVNNKNPL